MRRVERSTRVRSLPPCPPVPSLVFPYLVDPPLLLPPSILIFPLPPFLLLYSDPTRICRFSHDGNYLASSASSADGIVIVRTSFAPLSSFLLDLVHCFLSLGLTSPPSTQSEVPSLTPLHTIPTATQCDSLAWHPTKNLLAYGGMEACIWGAGI